MAVTVVTMEVGNDGVAVISISNPPLNVLTVAIIAVMKEKFSEATRRSDVKAIVLTGKGGRFSGGFDISAFQKVHKSGDVSDSPNESFDLIVNTIEDCKKPVVAAVEGLALGGGLELAMGCHARIAAPKTQLGLPELTLGVIPGLGGTQRLPRLVGVSKAVEMLLFSKPIMSEEGKFQGLIDDIASSEELLRASRLWALGIVERRKPWVRSLHRTDKIGSLSEAQGLLRNAREQAKRTAPNMPQHLACLDVVEEGILHGGYAGLLKEATVAKELVLSNTSKALAHLFFAQRTTAKAVIEDVPLKQKIFTELEKVCSSCCILATNTSTIDLNVIGEKTNSQARIIGAHFFSPAHVMPLLEIVRTEKTSPQVILDLLTVGKIIKKVPIVVGNCTGFAVNRTFFPYMQGPHLLVNLGVDLFRIDRVIRNFGLPIGPFQLQDLGGYRLGLAAGKEFANAFPDRTFRSPLTELLLKNGRNGKSNGKGFYIYEKGSRPKPDPSVLPIIEESRQLMNIMPGGKPISVTDKEILEMLLFPAVNEACLVLDEGVVARASDLDVASVLGMSFPSYRGGIMFWADTVGSNHIYTSLKRWSEIYGSFFKPSRFLEERAVKGMPLSAPATSSPKSNSKL
ncbi:PREDICTED: peroxisomal fatty acid beta-oxidation multifunctional protein AIM1 isoform X3 [Theobroma cacao]|uniref:Peroxisomal fatty acid beta-oxidation multifunctional protein AIM1 isoform X3 n=1 Tax=Theobroma cacao TaxID=3641 RepID=A0AB32WZN2_THECC|nr:PREDICTED: peroxisomal fatty acid beta-oxidation multifunctional protein AIM1 isoform X3 [Theobroma cacao]